MAAKQHIEEPQLLTWNTPQEKTVAMSHYLDVQDSYEPVYKAKADYYYDSYLDIEPNKSVKTGFGPNDYYSFRPGEMVPKRAKHIIKMCMEAYDQVGIIKNVIDLMGDFGSQGIQLVHENPDIEDFYQQWFKKVDGKERSERFLNTLYRCGNVMVYRSTAKITPAIETYLKSIGTADIAITFPDVKKNQIPWRYNFFNPLTVDLVKGELNLFLGRQQNFEMSANSFFSNFKSGPDVPETMLDTLPRDIRNLIKTGVKKIPLDPERLHIAYYKKDDWQLWAHPLTYAIMEDVITLKKMRLADLAALDGAISNIRLWTVGSLEHKILPTRAGINKLRNILASNTGGGTVELVWGPELTFKESASQVYKYLGPDKYTTVLNSIFAGLGIPPTMTGMATNGGGFTNNYISLKTLVERLQYGRDLLTKFWEKEIEIVRKAMGFKKPAKIIFNQMSLSDDSAEKDLLIQLVDRDIISSETILERFNEIPSVEKMRLIREEEERKKENLPPKLGPYPAAIAPNPNNKDGTPKQTIVEGNGRPRFRRDSGPRKQRVDKPKSTPGVAELMMWTQEAYDEISSVTNAAYLEMHSKANLRQLLNAQVVELESIKIDVLCNLEVMSHATEEEIHRILRENHKAPAQFRQFISANKINPIDLPMDRYKREIVGNYTEFILVQNS